MSVKNKVTLLLVLALLLAGCAPGAQTPQVQDIQIVQAQERSILAYGNGEVRVRPDVVRFTINIENRQTELAAAKEENEKIVQKVLASLEKHGILKSDVKEDYPFTEVDGINSKIYGYIYRQSIKVTLHDLTKWEPLFNDIFEAGAYQISDIYFRTSNINVFLEQALSLAIADAKNKAEVMADELGGQIGEPLSVNEMPYTDPYQTGPYYSTLTSNDVKTESIFGQLKETAFKEITIQTRVSVEFQLK